MPDKGQHLFISYSPDRGSNWLMHYAGVSIAVMQSIENRGGNDLSFEFIRQRGTRFAKHGWYALINPLMGSRTIVVSDKLVEDSAQLMLIQYQEVVQAFPLQSSNEPFTEGI